jgi:hypothetical protein
MPTNERHFLELQIQGIHINELSDRSEKINTQWTLNIRLNNNLGHILIYLLKIGQKNIHVSVNSSATFFGHSATFRLKIKRITQYKTLLKH